MKPRIPRLVAAAAGALWLAITATAPAQGEDNPALDSTPPPLNAAATPARPGRTPKPRSKATDKAARKALDRNSRPAPGSPLGPAAAPAPKASGKDAREAAAPDPVEPANSSAPKDIPLPLGIGRSAAQLKIPEVNAAGQILTLIMAAKATRTDQEHVQMKEMTMEFRQPDGKEDFHVVLPASTLNLQTHIISSSDPVEVRTADFELTGDKMEFNTLDRTGALTGHVRMTIHNLKKVAAVPDSPASHE